MANPLIGVITGNRGALTDFSVHLHRQQIKYGAFLSTVLQFLIVAAVIYFVVSGLKLDRMDRKKDEEPKVVEKARQNNKR